MCFVIGLSLLHIYLGLWSFETPAALDELASVTLLGETFPLE